MEKTNRPVQTREPHLPKLIAFRYQAVRKRAELAEDTDEFSVIYLLWNEAVLHRDFKIKLRLDKQRVCAQKTENASLVLHSSFEEGTAWLER